MLASMWLAAGCSDCPDSSTIRADIQAAIARGIEATREQDIDAYMALIPEDAVLLEGSGGVLDREQLKANVLRDWSIIPRTLSISATIDSVEADCNVAVVYTSQRWERLMLQRDGKTTDTVLTTQRHKEIWRKTKHGWLAHEVEELGGDVFVNGQRFDTGS